MTVRRRRSPVLLLVAAFALAWAGLVALPGQPAHAAPAATHPPTLSWALRVSGFGQPVLVTDVPDRSGRLVVVDRLGRLITYIPGQAGGRVYLDVRSTVSAGGGEQGLLGVAFYPGFATNPFFYVSYTRSDGALVISKFKVAGGAAALTVSPAAEQVMLVVPHPTYHNHNGGMLAFGPGAKLFISTGDGGGEGDPVGLSQTGRTLTGKILRIDIQHGCTPHPLYCVPSDNPLAAFPQYRGEVWDVGLRNPWRFSIDPANGNLWIGDVGQDRYEEIDLTSATQKGLNMGWSCREGRSVYLASRCAAGVQYFAPIVVIPHPTAEAIIGGLVYHGSKYQSVMGPRYIFGDYITGHVWTMPAVAGGTPTLAGSLSQVTSFGADISGEVWATSLSGGLYQMSAR